VHFTNWSYKEVYETVVQDQQSSPIVGNDYKFCPQNGVNWGIEKNFGAKAMGLSIKWSNIVIGGGEKTFWEEKLLKKSLTSTNMKRESIFHYRLKLKW